MLSKINAALVEIEACLIEIRHDFHRFPELSFCENRTAERISKLLTDWGIEHKTGIAKTGICAFIGKNESKKTLLIRADMDALPQVEKTQLSYKSENEGVMHACGHDMHMTVALGAAFVLNRLKDSLNCNIKIIFQPGEEDTGGALPMINEGVLINPEVTAAVSCHVSNEVETGKVRLKKGAMMASPDDYDIIIKGRGGHGAYPEKCINPITAAADVIKAFVALSEEERNENEPKVISVCKIEGGSFYNIIPDSVTIGGTVRAFNEDVRKRLALKMEECVKNIVSDYGGDYTFDYRFRYPPLINDDGLCEKFAKSAEKILGKGNVFYTDEVSMAGEDFAYFAQNIPSVFFNLGTKNEKTGATEPLHSTSFIIDDNAIRVGVGAICSFALDYK